MSNLSLKLEQSSCSQGTCIAPKIWLAKVVGPKGKTRTGLNAIAQSIPISTHRVRDCQVVKQLCEYQPFTASTEEDTKSWWGNYLFSTTQTCHNSAGMWHLSGWSQAGSSNGFQGESDHLVDNS